MLALAVSAHAVGTLDRVLIGLLALASLAAFEAVQPLPEALRELRTTVGAGERILELTGREPAVADPADPLPLPPVPFTVGLEDVASAAPPANGRHSTASASGSSRAAGLRCSGPAERQDDSREPAPALHRPGGGRVTLDGRDLRDYRREDVRRAIASLAGQDSHSSRPRSARTSASLAGGDGRRDREDTSGGRILTGSAAFPTAGTPSSARRAASLRWSAPAPVVARALLANAPVLVLDEPTAPRRADGRA